MDQMLKFIPLLKSWNCPPQNLINVKLAFGVDHIKYCHVIIQALIDFSNTSFYLTFIFYIQATRACRIRIGVTLAALIRLSYFKMENLSKQISDMFKITAKCEQLFSLQLWQHWRVNIDMTWVVSKHSHQDWAKFSFI